ncbi:ATP-binding protein [Actinoplanes sp. NPDC051411]|uniref:ATP-binding protein n=1 Tax=Actinoplanes sp. NPDC051411 TaxID=3155522 RepID=UPI003436E9C3
MSSLPASVPHPAAVELRCWRLDNFRELRRLRADLRDAVAGSANRTPGDLAERMAVVATELATNALRHGLPPTEVRLLRDHDRLIIDVADHDLQAAPVLDEDRPLGAGGLGLQLTREFAVDVGWYITGATKHVWAGFPS